MRISSALITAIERIYYASHRPADIVSWLSQTLGPQSSTSAVLDFGGGDGHVSQELQRRVGGRFLVAEISMPALRSMKHVPGVLPVAVSPIPQLPFRTAGLTGVVLVDAFHHINRQEEALTELIRCLQPGGTLAIVEVQRLHPVTWVFRVLLRMSGRWCKFLTPSELVTTLRARGLRVSVTRLDGLRYGVSARR